MVVGSVHAAEVHGAAEQIKEALDVWIGHRFRYAGDAQRDAVRDLFRRGREVYARLKE